MVEILKKFYENFEQILEIFRTNVCKITVQIS